jgi:hypothetical protein
MMTPTVCGAAAKNFEALAPDAGAAATCGSRAHEVLDQSRVGKFQQFDDLSIFEPEFIQQISRNDNVPWDKPYLDAAMNRDTIAIDHCLNDIAFHELEGYDEVGHGIPQTAMTLHRTCDFEHFFFAL